MEQRENDGNTSAYWSSLKDTHPDWIAQKKLKFPQYGAHPQPEPKGVAFALDLIKDPVKFDLARRLRERRCPRRARASRVGDYAEPCYAARLAATTFAPPIGIWRGFCASGISRTRSTCRRPFSSDAPVTWTWSASWKRRSKARAAMP